MMRKISKAGGIDVDDDEEVCCGGNEYDGGDVGDAELCVCNSLQRPCQALPSCA